MPTVFEQWEEAVLTGDLETGTALLKAVRAQSKKPQELKPLDHDHPMEGMVPGEHTRHLRYHEEEYRKLKAQLLHEQDPAVKESVTGHLRNCVKHWQEHRKAKYCPPLKDSEKLVKPEDVDQYSPLDGLPNGEEAQPSKKQRGAKVQKALASAQYVEYHSHVPHPEGGHALNFHPRNALGQPGPKMRSSPIKIITHHGDPAGIAPSGHSLYSVHTASGSHYMFTAPQAHMSTVAAQAKIPIGGQPHPAPKAPQPVPTPQPSPVQKALMEAGETVDYGPFRVRIEQAPGDVRRGKNHLGEDWETTFRWAYGELVGSQGCDGDPCDVFLGEDPTAPFAYIIHQHDLAKVHGWPGGCCPQCGNPPHLCAHDHDEDKVCLGFPSEEEAVQAYLLSYDNDQFLGPVTKVSVTQLQEWLKEKRGKILKAVLDARLDIRKAFGFAKKHPLIKVPPGSQHFEAHTPHYHKPFVEAIKAAVPYQDRKWVKQDQAGHWSVHLKHLPVVGHLMHTFWDASKHPKDAHGHFASKGGKHPLHDPVHAAVKEMSGMDLDHGKQKNDIGWNGTDSNYGHYLAQQPELSHGQVEAGLKMLQKYKNTQLGHYQGTLFGPEAETAKSTGKMAVTPPLSTQQAVVQAALAAEDAQKAHAAKQPPADMSHQSAETGTGVTAEPEAAPAPVEGMSQPSEVLGTGVTEPAPAKTPMSALQSLQELGGAATGPNIASHAGLSIQDAMTQLNQLEAAGEVTFLFPNWTLLTASGVVQNGFQGIPMDQWGKTKPWDSPKDYYGLQQVPSEFQGWKSHVLTLSPEALEAHPAFTEWEKGFLGDNLGKSANQLSYKQVAVLEKLQKKHRGWIQANPGVIPTLFQDFHAKQLAQEAEKQAALEAASKEKTEALAEQSNTELELPPGMNPKLELFPHQKAGVNWLKKIKKGILALATGLGKALDNDAKVLTPTGWARNGDLQVGDLVMAGDGTPTRVTGVFPQGPVECFRVGFSDGAAVVTCGEHLWETRSRNERTYRKGAKPWVARTTQGISEALRVPAGGGMDTWNYSIPMAGTVEFSEQEVGLHPYLMGALLGNGCFKNRSIGFSSADEFVLKMVRELLPEEVSLVHDTGPDYRISAGRVVHAPGVSVNPVIAAIRGMGLLGKGSHEKHLPEEYLFNTPEARLAVLRGLMDTDGWVSADGMIVQYVSTSEALALAVQQLAQSFGGTATIKTKIPTYTYRGENRKGRLAYTVHLDLPPAINLFLTPRKAERVVPRSKYPPRRYVTAVEPVGPREATCISVEHPSCLYITEHYLVTHNTWTVTTAFESLRSEGKAHRMGFIVPKGRLVGTVRDIEEAFAGRKIVVIASGGLGKNVQLPANVQVFEGLEEPVAALPEGNGPLQLIYAEVHNQAKNKTQDLANVAGVSQELADQALAELVASGHIIKQANGHYVPGDGKKMNSALLAAMQQADYVVSGYDPVRKYANVFRDTCDCMAYDESVRLKGKDSIISKEVIDKFKDTPYMWYMSATPIPNSPTDLFVLMKGLKPEVFGDYGQFKKEHCKIQYNPYTKGYDIKGYKDVQATRAAVEHLIYHRDYDSKDVQLVMPERSYAKNTLDMPPALAKVYDAAKNAILEEALAEGSHKFNPKNALSALLRLEQISLTPRLLDPTYSGPEPKLQQAAALASAHFAEQEEAGKVPPKGIIFFSHFLGAQEYLQQHLQGTGLAPSEIATIKGSDYRVGGKKVKTIQEVVDAMNSGQVKSLIASDAAMEGLNLQYGATKLVHLDTPWRPDALEQREGRIFRPGQKETCQFTRLLLDNGVEKKKDSTVTEKAKTQSAIIAGADTETYQEFGWNDFMEALDAPGYKKTGPKAESDLEAQVYLGKGLETKLPRGLSSPGKIALEGSYELVFA